MRPDGSKTIMNFTWDLPYSSQREPVNAANIVATSQPLAAQAGLHMLREGGNAVDAAIATAICLTVVEPTANGIGSDNFALVWAGGGLHGLNSSGRSPKNLDLSQYKEGEAIAPRGWGSVTVPGAVMGWVMLSEQFGALPFKKLFEPAIQYSRRGFPVSPQTADGWGRSCRIYRELESFLDTFAPGGNLPKAGEIFKSEGHAQSYELIAASKGKAFYEGELAEKIAKHARQTGGQMTVDDLAAHKSSWVRPIQTHYKDINLHEIPPNGQGITALIALGIARHFDLASMEVDSVESLHVQIEAMKLAFRDAHAHIADPAHMRVSPDDLLNDDYLASRAKLIDTKRAQDFKHGEPKHGGTVLLCAADQEGTMISLIQSNYTGFGSGIVIPETGISMQSRGACFTTEKGHPNEVAGGKLPYHTIIPGFVTNNSLSPRERAGVRADGSATSAASPEPLMAFGVMGGFMQPQGHMQVIIRMTDYHQNPQAALDAPRFQVFDGLKVGIEPGFKPEVYEGLRALGHDLDVADARHVLYGGGQAIYKLSETGGVAAYCGASDLRRDGQAVGF